MFVTDGAESGAVLWSKVLQSPAKHPAVVSVSQQRHRLLSSSPFEMFARSPTLEMTTNVSVPQPSPQPSFSFVVVPHPRAKALNATDDGNQVRQENRLFDLIYGRSRPVVFCHNCCRRKVVVRCRLVAVVDIGEWVIPPERFDGSTYRFFCVDAPRVLSPSPLQHPAAPSLNGLPLPLQRFPDTLPFGHREGLEDKATKSAPLRPGGGSVRETYMPKLS